MASELVMSTTPAMQSYRFFMCHPSSSVFIIKNREDSTFIFVALALTFPLRRRQDKAEAKRVAINNELTK